jgi:hypothetical protein
VAAATEKAEVRERSRRNWLGAMAGLLAPWGPLLALILVPEGAGDRYGGSYFLLPTMLVEPFVVALVAAFVTIRSFRGSLPRPALATWGLVAGVTLATCTLLALPLTLRADAFFSKMMHATLAVGAAVGAVPSAFIAWRERARLKRR